jgi:hypothetical protein
VQYAARAVSRSARDAQRRIGTHPPRSVHVSNRRCRAHLSHPISWSSSARPELVRNILGRRHVARP